MSIMQEEEDSVWEWITARKGTVSVDESTEEDEIEVRDEIVAAAPGVVGVGAMVGTGEPDVVMNLER